MSRKKAALVLYKLIAVLGAFLAIIIILIAPTGLLGQSTAAGVVVDNSGISTELSPMTTDASTFAGYYVRGLGISIVTKDFRTPTDLVGEVEQWFFFSQFTSLERNGDILQLRLKDGSSVRGRSGIAKFVRGAFPLGEFSLKLQDLRSLTVRNSAAPPEVEKRGGRRGTLELRDGTTMIMNDLVMYRTISVRYSDNVYPEPTMWMQVTRGQASVKTKIPFEKISTIDFDKPVVRGDKMRLTLVDGTVLSGTCGCDGPLEECTDLAGSTDTALTWIRSSGFGLGYVIRTIRFE
jgi:hypothetical protein